MNFNKNKDKIKGNNNCLYNSNKKFNKPIQLLIKNDQL